MPDTIRSSAAMQARVVGYARSLGLTDERAVAAALHHLEARHRRGSARAVDEACALLRSWWRHPSCQSAAA